MTRTPGGVRGYDDIRFWLCLFLYLIAAVFFFERHLAWNSLYIFMPGLIAFVVVSTIAWDYRIIGNPGNSFCAILHFAFFIALIFLLNRLAALGILSSPLVEPPRILGSVVAGLQALPVVSDLLRFLSLIMDSLGLCLLLFLVSFAIIFKRNVALPLLTIFALAVLLLAVGRNLETSTGTTWSLVAGVAAMAVAFMLQREDERQNVFWNHVADTLRPTASRPLIDMEIKVGLLRRLYRTGALGEREIRGVVAGRLGCSSEDPGLKPVCVRALDQMIAQEGLAEARDGRYGQRVVLTVTDCPPDFFYNCARVLRTGVILLFAGLYILSPVDLIPDAIPVVGLLDDLAIGAVGLLSGVRTYQGMGGEAERVVRELPMR